jgi:hypothetical protein
MIHSFLTPKPKEFDFLKKSILKIEELGIAETAVIPDHRRLQQGKLKLGHITRSYLKIYMNKNRHQ